jgi:DNA-binding response OmpR family regulator
MMDDPTVLIVEQDPDLASVLRTWIRRYVRRVLVAESGEAALAVMRVRRPWLVVCDVELPDVPGFTVLKRAHTDPQLAAIPFILIAADQSRDAQLTGLRLGAIDYLPKPVHPAALEARLLHQLERHRALAA